ncbi:MAG: prenyltransferase, partial [Myxococcota bacterium]
MKTALAWLKASRLPSQSYIALPLLMGQAWAWVAAGPQGSAVWSWAVFVLVQLFGVFDQLYIVYANDYADRDTDALNDTFTIFSGGSRVLVDGEIRPEQLKLAAQVMATCALLTGVALGVGFGRWQVLPLQAVGLGLLWAYSYPPLRLSYRGGGELLQALGMGLVLPLLGYVAQAGTTQGFPWVAMWFFVPLQLAGGMATSLPDEPSDRASKKRTTSVTWGNKVTKILIVCILLATLVTWVFATGPSRGITPTWYALATPIASIAGMILVGAWAKPGTLALNVFVFFGILANLSIVVA